MQVVNRQQHRRLLAETLYDRQEASRYRALIGRLAIRVGPQQDPIDRASLRVRQVGERGRIDVGQKIGQRGVRQY